ncbi:hypothetical protein JCM8547_009216 [Rhodosporidiobolus lusitaniae]
MTATTRSVNEVTRACYAKGVSPSIWLSLVKQAAEVGGSTAEVLEKEVTESLVSLLRGSAPPPPLVVQYIQQALHTFSSSTAQQGRLVRPSFLARSATIASLPSFSTDAVLAAVNAALRAAPKESCYAATTPEEVAQGLLLVLDYLLPLLSSSTTAMPEIAEWFSRFLLKPPHLLSKKTVSPELLEQVLAGLRKAVDLVQSRQDLQRLKNDLELTLNRLSSAGRRRAAPPSSLDSPSRELSLEPDALLLVSHLVSYLHLPTSSAATQLSSFLLYRLSQAPFRGTSKTEALVRALADFLLPLLLTAGRPKREDATLEGWLLAKVPHLLETVGQEAELQREDGEGFHTSLAEALQLVRSSLASTGSGEAMDIDGSSGSFDRFVIALCQGSPLSSDLGASLSANVDRGDLEPFQPSDYASRLAGGDPDELKQVLEELVSTPPAQRAISSAVRDTIASLASPSLSDLNNLAATCEILVESTDALSVLFLHVEPKEVLEPVHRVLDNFEASQDDFGDINPVERYGAFVLFVQIVAARFKLYSNLVYHLGSASTFLTAWLPSSSGTYPLSVMSDDERAAVSGWVAALFGEGISDDLMHATNPHTLLRVAPTILKQSLMACQAGVVDLDNLRDALSYFLQELLRFTLPGVLRWLIEEIERTPSSTARHSMVDILQVFIFSDALPQPVLELIAPDLAILLSTLPSETADASSVVPGTVLDPSKLRKLIAPYKPRRPAVVWADPTGESWQASLLDSMNTLADSPARSLSHLSYLSQALSSSIASSSPSTFLRTALLPHLLSLATSSTPSTDSLDSDLRLGRIERAGSFFLAFSPSSTSIPPLLNSFATQVLPASFSEWASRQLPRLSSEGAVEQKKLDLLADVFGGALVLASSGRADVQVLLEGVATAAEGALKGTKRTKPAAEEDDEEEDGSLGLMVFLDRLLSWPLVLAQCPRLVKLVDKQ